MGSTAIPAQGSTFAVDTSSSGSGTFVPVANLRDFSGFDGTASEIDVTNMASQAKEFRIGLGDNGQFTLNLDRDFSDAGQTALLAARDSHAAKQFRLQLPNGESATFTGFVKKFSLTGGVDQVLKGAVDIRISGSVLWSSV